jgi:tRNA1(Val) A37 N6-methylase TrmN6
MVIFTDDAFLGGDLQVLQPKGGYRAAMDAVLLAASISARPGQSVLDMGSGVGVVSMCVTHRLPGVKITGLEIQSELTDLASQNYQRNSLAGIEVIEGDVFDPPSELTPNSFDVVMTNPPFYDHGKGHSPPDESKTKSHMHSGPEAVKNWLEKSILFVKPLGIISMVFPASELATILAHLSGPLGNIAIFPLWPGNGKAAKRVIISGQKGAAGQVRLLPGLKLHAPPERYSPEAEEVLRHGHGIDMS